MAEESLIIIRGGGDIATGVIQKFARAGFNVLVLETTQPTAIRRTVALCEAVYSGTMQVEDITCRLINSTGEMQECFDKGEVPLLIDESGESIKQLKPACVIDAILAKRNLGTTMSIAPVTIALGPGFTAGRDVHAVVETMRGHSLGRLYFEGGAIPNTGAPGEIGGKSEERVIHAPNGGTVHSENKIGDIIEKGKPVLFVGNTPCPAPFSGLLRGLIKNGLTVPKGMKIADIDPRTDVDFNTISDKARNVGGAALEAFLYLRSKSRH